MVSRKQIVAIVFITLLIIPSLILGFRLTKNPADLVKLSLNQKEVEPSDELVLTVKNHGFKWISIGYDNEISCVYPNGSLRIIEYPPNVAWHPVGLSISPLIGSHQEKVYIKHLEPGEYRLKKEFKIKGLGYSKEIDFIIL